MRRVAIIERTRELTRAVRPSFEREEFIVEWFGAGHVGLHALRARPFDVLLLEMTLPDIDALVVCRIARDLKQGRQLGILTFSDRHDEDAIIAAFESGADDHVTKSASPREIVARACAVLRRRANGSAARSSYADHELTIILDANVVIRGRERLQLSRGEAEVLDILLRRAPAVVTVEEICADLSTDARSLARATVVARIKGLRTKLGSPYIETRTGFGYAFVPQKTHHCSSAPDEANSSNEL